MNDSFRSLAVLGIAFVSVVALTFGLAALIVPNPAASAPDDEPSRSGPGGARPSAGPITTVGGTLVVSGVREALFTLDREELGNRYALAGPKGRIIFEGMPLTVAQISYDGLEFFLEPHECSVTPGERHDETGVGSARVTCEDIPDVRDQGTVTIDGMVGVAANLLGLRGELPESGGTVTLGTETLTFDFAAMTIPTSAQFRGIFAGSLYDPEREASLTFTYDPRDHEIVLGEIAYGGEARAAGVEVTQVPAGACSVTTSEIGLLNPHTRVVDMTIRCAAVDVPTLGTVPIEGTLVVELSEPPG